MIWLLQAKYYESGFARIMFEAHGERVALGRFTADSGLIEGSGMVFSRFQSIILLREPAAICR